MCWAHVLAGFRHALGLALSAPGGDCKAGSVVGKVVPTKGSGPGTRGAGLVPEALWTLVLLPLVRVVYVFGFWGYGGGYGGPDASLGPECFGACVLESGVLSRPTPTPVRRAQPA